MIPWIPYSFVVCKARVWNHGKNRSLTLLLWGTGGGFPHLLILRLELDQINFFCLFRIG
jgi:hypothetical protein